MTDISDDDKASNESWQVSKWGGHKLDDTWDHLTEWCRKVLRWLFRNGKQCPVLRTIALKAFSLAASSAASKQNFSTNALMTAKLLKEENVQKLLFMKSNALKFEKDLLAMDWKGSEDIVKDVESVSSN